MKFLNTTVCTDFPKSTQRKRPSFFFRDRFDGNVERLGKNVYDFSESRTKYGMEEVDECPFTQSAELFGTCSGGFCRGNLRESGDLENIGVVGKTILK